MQQNDTLQNNTVTIAGKICSEITFSHEVFGEGFYSFELSIPRLSESSDILPATISDRLFNKEELQPGANVLIEGQLRSYNNYREKRNKLILTIFVHDIKYLDETNLPANSNQIYLNGYVCKPPIYRTTPFGREIVDILLAVNRPYKKSDYIPCIAWGRNAKYGGNLNVGDNLKVWGRIQSRTYQKKLEDETVIDKIAYEVSVAKMETT